MNMPSENGLQLVLDLEVTPQAEQQDVEQMNTLHRSNVICAVSKFSDKRSNRTLAALRMVLQHARTLTW